MENLIVESDGTVEIIWPCLSVAIAQTVCFILGQNKKDNSYIDMAWNLTFVLPNAVVIGGKMAAN